MPAPLVGIAIGAAARAVAKKAAGKAVKKTVAKKAAKAAKSLKKSDEKIMTEVVQGRSVRVVKPQKAGTRLEKNAAEKSKVETAKSGVFAKSQANSVKQSKPAKVVKINSGKTTPKIPAKKL